MARDARGREVIVGQHAALYGRIVAVDDDGSVTLEPDNATTAEAEAHATSEAEWHAEQKEGQSLTRPCPRLEKADSPLIIFDVRLLEVHAEPQV